MVNKDAINMLIDQIPAIKSLFAQENLTMFSSYNYRTRTREHSGIELQTIYKNPVFYSGKNSCVLNLVR